MFMILFRFICKQDALIILHPCALSSLSARFKIFFLSVFSPQKERPDVEEQPEVKEGVPKTADKEDKHIKEA